MTTEQVAPGDEPGLGLLVARALGVAALVVAASAALFVGLGEVGDAPLVVADGPTASGADTPEPDTDVEPQEPPEPEEPQEPEEEPEPEPEPQEPEQEPEPEPEPQEPEEEPGRIDPAAISVQVLDGYQGDGGAAADAVAAQLAETGYPIVAQNPALRYETTAVLWTAGSEAAGQQVARDIGAAEVREQPGNLSTAVMVHVVVGADRG